MENSKLYFGYSCQAQVLSFVQFRYADTFDILMIITGFFMAIAAGVAIPAHTILLGRVINNFAYHSIIVTRENAEVSLSSVAQSLALSLNTTCTELVEEDPLLILNIAESNSSILLCSNQGQEVFQEVLEYVCDPASQLQLEIGCLCLYYVAVASGLLVFYFLESQLEGKGSIK